MSEYKLHIATKEHIEKCFIGPQNPSLKFWHVANETRDAEQAFWNKKMGVLPGVLDFQFGWPVSKAGVLELKFGKNKLTSQQNHFISWAHFIGWHTGVATTVRQAHNILEQWGLKPLYNVVIEPDYRTQEKRQEDAFDYSAPPKT